MLSDSCLSVCLSLTLVYRGQAAGWIRILLCAKIGLGQGHIVLDGDPAPPMEKGHTLPQFSVTVVAKRSPISATAELLYSQP